jgi:hypothetical protein
MQVKKETLPTRCEVCHQTDCFNPETNHCNRCFGVLRITLVNKTSFWQRINDLPLSYTLVLVDDSLASFINAMVLLPPNNKFGINTINGINKFVIYMKHTLLLLSTCFAFIVSMVSFVFFFKNIMEDIVVALFALPVFIMSVVLYCACSSVIRKLKPEERSVYQDIF